MDGLHDVASINRMLSAAANSHLLELDRVRRENDGVTRKVNKIHSKLRETEPERAEKLKEELWVKLRGFYVEAKQWAEAEERLAYTCAQDLLPLLPPGFQLPQRKKSEVHEAKRKRPRPEDSGGPSTSGAAPATSPQAYDHSSIMPGDMVAARVSAEETVTDEWILVKVTKCDHDNRRYEVIDEEPGENDQGGPRKYILPDACIIPLPKPTDANKTPDYPPGSVVLALYPGTTALYRSQVVGHPRKRKSDDFFLEFDGDEQEGLEGLPQRRVPFYQVVAYPEARS